MPAVMIATVKNGKVVAKVRHLFNLLTMLS